MGVVIAEALKLLRHRGMWGLVWIFPLLVTVFFVGGLALQLSHGLDGRVVPAEPAAIWIARTTTAWQAAAGPGRLLVGAFAALAFGGEYGWNTWKLIVPHRRRLQLIAAKYVVVVALLMAALVLAAVLAVVFGLIGPAVRGLPLPQGVTIGDLLAAHGRSALAALFAILLSVGYGSAAAILMRSTLGGAVVSVVAVTVEGLVGALAPLLDRRLYLALPPFHLNNLTAFILGGKGVAQGLPSGLLQESWGVSLAWMAAWILGLVALAAIAFDRQDLN